MGNLLSARAINEAGAMRADANIHSGAVNARATVEDGAFLAKVGGAQRNGIIESGAFRTAATIENGALRASGKAIIERDAMKATVAMHERAVQGTATVERGAVQVGANIHPDAVRMIATMSENGVNVKIINNIDSGGFVILAGLGLTLSTFVLVVLLIFAPFPNPVLTVGGISALTAGIAYAQRRLIEAVPELRRVAAFDPWRHCRASAVSTRRY
ncbi:hypothetical protein DFJ73DRAFT_773014 [Zopfochytrium polystomum]|nr:hypothetical protein DFJ73DRAFT_773014 [Zopfochytrium polystomum]